MTTRIRVLAAALCLAGTASGLLTQGAFAQSTRPAPRSGAARGEVRPAAEARPNEGQPAAGQPVAGPPLPRKVAPAPKAPFVLTPEEEAQLDRLLAAWQKQTEKIRKFHCLFTLFTYDAAFAKDDAKPVTPKEEKGELYYSFPDKGSYKIFEEDGAHWICDGRAVFEYNHADKKVVEHVLPPEMQGKAISEGPLPFLFGAEAEKQKRRYFLRICTPENVMKAGGEVWLQAFPRFQADAANFRSARIILNDRNMLPKALEIVDTNGQSRRAFSFEKVGVNELFSGVWNNPFKADVPIGWKKEVQNPPVADSPTEGPSKPKTPPAAARKPAPAATQPKRK